MHTVLQPERLAPFVEQLSLSEQPLERPVEPAYRTASWRNARDVCDGDGDGDVVADPVVRLSWTARTDNACWVLVGENDIRHCTLRPVYNMVRSTDFAHSFISFYSFSVARIMEHHTEEYHPALDQSKQQASQVPCIEKKGIIAMVSYNTSYDLSPTSSNRPCSLVAP